MLLKDICSFKNGKDIRITNNGLVPVYGSTGIIGSTNTPLISSPSCLIARVGANCGYVQFVKIPCWVTDNTIICSAKSNIDIKYIYYLLQSIDINNMRIGSSQPLITSSILNDIEVIEHTYAEQNHIVNTISSALISLLLFLLIVYFLQISLIILVITF